MMRKTRFKIGDCIILDYTERPSARMIAVIVDIIVNDDKPECYVWNYLNADPSFDSHNEKRSDVGSLLIKATKLSDFGVTLHIDGHKYWCEQTGRSEAVYADGSYREWQEYSGKEVFVGRPELIQLILNKGKCQKPKYEDIKEEPEEISGKWSISTNEENYNKLFNTAEEAIRYGHWSKYDEFWVGQCVAPVQPELLFNGSDIETWLDMTVYQHDDYTGEWAENAVDANDNQLEELAAEIRPVIAAWLDRHKLRPTHWQIDPTTVVRVSDNEKKNEVPKHS
jgi:hypothetical protein